MAIYKEDIVDINLSTGNIFRSFMSHTIGYKDQQADHFGVRVFRDGEAVNLTGVSVQGIFMPPQGDPIAITSGNIVSGNVAYVVLPQACYNYNGQFCLAIKLVDSSNNITGTVRIVDGMVDNTNASGTVAPTTAVPTYQEVLSAYEQAIVVINKSVRFDTTQSLTDVQKTTARENIDSAYAEDVSNLKDAIDNDTLAFAFNLASFDGFWNSSGEYQSNSGLRGSVKHTIQESVKGFYYSNPSGIGVCAVFWDSNDDVVSSTLESNGIGEMFIPVPDGAVTVAFNFKKTELDEDYVRISSKDYQFDIDEEFFSHVPFSYDNAFVNSDGTNQYNTAYKASTFMPVNPHATHLRCETVYRGGALALYAAFYDIDYSFITGSNILYQNAQTTYEPIPSGAKYIRINGDADATYRKLYRLSYTTLDYKRNLKGYALGDSITVGETNNSISYVDYMRNNGFNLTKLAVSGRQISNGGIYQTGNDWITHLDDIPVDGVYYTLLCGTNDFNADNPIGTVDSTDTTTVCGALNAIFNKIQSGKKVTLIVFSPIRRTDQTTNGIGLTLSDYVEAIRETCKNVGIPFVDLYSDCDISSLSASVMLSADGVHPNKDGQGAIFRRYYQEIDSRLKERMY